MKEAKPMMFNEKTINRLAASHILAGLEMGIQGALDMLNSTRRALGMPPMRLVSGDEQDTDDLPMLAAAAPPARRGRPSGPTALSKEQYGDPRLLLRVRELRSRGWSVRRIAEEINVSVWQTSRLVKVAVIAREGTLEKALERVAAKSGATAHEAKAGATVENDDVSRARALRAQNFTYGEIAKKLGVSLATAGRWLRGSSSPGRDAMSSTNVNFLRSHTAERWRIVKEAGLDSGGKLPSNKLLEQAKRILADREHKAEGAHK